MTHVYLLWHVHHFAPDESGVVRHFENADDYWDEDEDNIKLLGVYSSREAAERRIGEARTLPGFRDEPHCFHISPYELDRDEWTTGYFTATYPVPDPAPDPGTAAEAARDRHVDRPGPHAPPRPPRGPAAPGSGAGP